MNKLLFFLILFCHIWGYEVCFAENPDTRELAIGILNKAYELRNSNYPDTPVLYNVYYTEKEEAEDNSFVSEYEAILHIFRDSYIRETNREQIGLGQILLFHSTDSIEGRKADTEEVYRRYPAPRMMDFVFTDKEFIRPERFEQYDYELEGYTDYKDIPCYVIRFTAKKAPGYKGTIYIDTSSLAYVGGLIWSPRPNSVYTGAGYFTEKRIFGGVQAEVQYRNVNGKWHLQQLDYSIDDKQTIYRKFITTRIRFQTLYVDTVDNHAIPFRKQMTEKDYGIASTDKRNKVLIKESYYSLQTGISANSTEGVNTPFTFSEEGQILAVAPDISAPSQLLMFGDELGMRLTRQIWVSARTTYSLNFRDWKVSSDYTMTWRTPLSRFRDNCFLEFSAGYSLRSASLYLQKIANPAPESLTIRGKRFDSKHIRVYAQNRTNGIPLRVSLTHLFAKRWEAYTSFSYIIPLSDKNYIRFKEAEGGIFKRKIADVPIDDSRLDSNGQALPQTESMKFYTNIGVRYCF